jgi:phage I-like protein
MKTDVRFVDDFSVVDLYQWFRILPIGKFSRFGRTVEITDEMLKDMVGNFRRVPPTRLPVNIEHEEEHGKVGSIDGLRHVPGDGLYALIDWTPVGKRLLEEQRFQYYSPEVIFGLQEYDGKMTKNILYGLALTNHPYFGTDTAVFSLKDIDTGAPGASPLNVSDLAEELPQMDENTVSNGVIKGIKEFFTQLSTAAPAAPLIAPTPELATVSLEAFNALNAENTRLKEEKAEAERVAAEAAHSNRVAAFATALGESMAPLAEKLALVAEGYGDAALADDLAQQFKALAAQADAGALFSEIGSAGGDPDMSIDEAARFTAAAERTAADKGITMTEAYSVVAREHPDWYAAHRAKTGKG